MAKRKTKWNGMCPANKHGLDYETQDCAACKAPQTREQATALYINFLTHEVKRLEAEVAEYKAKFAKDQSPAYLLSDLEWSVGFFEKTAKLTVCTSALEALTKEDATATIDFMVEFATATALDKCRFGWRSSSATANLTAQCMAQAWAEYATSIRSWYESIKTADAYYGKPQT